MRGRWTKALALPLAAALTTMRCEGDGAPIGPLEDLKATILSAEIWADLMPIVPPDPIVCRVEMLMRNTSPFETLLGLHVPGAEVFLLPTRERLGAIGFSTDWDGRLAPGEEDTVRLTKPASNSTLFAPPCDKYVSLLLTVRDAFGRSRAFPADSLPFGCGG